MIKYAYLHLNFEDDVIVRNLFCFCCALFTASEKSRRKESSQAPLANKRKDHSHTTPTLVSRTQYTCFRRVACTHADPSARLLPRESYKLVDPALKGFVHYRLLSHAEPMAYYIFYISRRKRPHEEKFKNR